MVGVIKKRIKFCAYLNFKCIKTDIHPYNPILIINRTEGCLQLLGDRSTRKSFLIDRHKLYCGQLL